MKLITYLTAVVVAAATLTTASAPVAGAAVPARAPAPARAAPAQDRQRATAEEVRVGRQGVAYFRGKTYRVQRRIPVPLTPTNYAERHTRSPAFLHYLKHLWHGRWIRAKHVLAAHRLPFTNDWQTAVRVVQQVWPGTSSWLLRCSGGEGGHAWWKWNGGQPYTGSLTPPPGSSGAGGWMQFMRGTFTGSYGQALAEARRLHLPVPVLKWARLPSVPAGTSAIVHAWLSPLAQAFAAGWARYHGASGAWDPGIDPNCA